MAATVTIMEVNGGNQAPVLTAVTSIRYCTADDPNPGLANPVKIPSSGFAYSFWKHHLLKLGGTFTRINNIRWYTDGSIGWTLGTGGQLLVARRDTGDNGCPVLGVPQNVAASAVAGGTLAAGTYYYVVTALNDFGETVGSQEVSASVDGTNTNAVQITWDAVEGATKYRVYGRASGAQDQYWETTNTSYTDTGTAGTAGSVPTTNSASAYDQAIGTVGVTGYALDDATNGHDYYKGQTVAPADAASYTANSPLMVDTVNHDAPTITKAVVTQVKVAADATQGEQAAETLTFVWDEI